MKLKFEAHEKSTIAEVGGKGYHLQKLISWEAHVAPFFVISTEAFNLFTQTGTIPLEITLSVEAFIAKHGKIALRSSMIGEDNLDASFAGLFETILGVDLSNWEVSLKKIYASMDSPRVKNYIIQKNITDLLKMAVVVQKEIRVDRSGVLFTRAPVAPTSAVAVDAAFGMGEGVVSGHVDVDHYLITRLGEVIHGQENKVLKIEEVQSLSRECLRLEKIFGAPADIEWGLQKDQLYIFQIRPITRSFSPIKVYADTNLSESYPGSVSPFTAAFVRRAYENVFMEAAGILGYQGERLKMLSQHCSHLISAVDDHLYYNLEPYYAVLRSLPGGEKNIENWHKMIGGKVDGAEVPYHDTAPSKFDLVISAIELIKFSQKKNRIYPEFLRQLDNFSTSIKVDMGNLKSSRDTIEYLGQLLDRPLGFGLTIVNDLYIMIGLGILSSRLKKMGLHEDAVIDLLKTSHSLDSVKPLEAFDHLTAALSEKFFEAFEKISAPSGFSPYEEAFQKLTQQGFVSEVKLLKEFLHEYGDRSFEELKLESLPLKNDPELLKNLLKWGSHNKSASHQGKVKTEDIELNFLDNKVAKFTRECIEFRESSRLWRGRFYHFIRELVIKLAEQLMVEDKSFAKFGLRDFFSLNHHEWKAFAQKKISVDDVCKLMNERLWQNKKQQYPEFVYWDEFEKLPNIEHVADASGVLKGQGVSPGLIEARALVLENPTEILGSDLDNFILVTKNTDPAWVYIMSRSKGLISEKGSMLSHTAIIGRELGIPTLVGVKGATHQIKTGDLIRIDGSTGEVSVL
jgi:phosphohistidine swiveling domain-containing protein